MTETEGDTMNLGLVHKMVLGLDEDGITPGVRLEFPPEYGVPPVQFLIDPNMALSLIAGLRELDKELGWSRNKPPSD